MGLPPFAKKFVHVTGSILQSLLPCAVIVYAHLKFCAMVTIMQHIWMCMTSSGCLIKLCFQSNVEKLKGPCLAKPVWVCLLEVLARSACGLQQSCYDGFHFVEFETDSFLGSQVAVYEEDFTVVRQERDRLAKEVERSRQCVASLEKEVEKLRQKVSARQIMVDTLPNVFELTFLSFFFLKVSLLPEVFCRDLSA